MGSEKSRFGLLSVGKPERIFFFLFMKGAQKEANCPRISCVGKDGLGLLFLGVLGLQVCTVVSDLWRVGGGQAEEIHCSHCFVGLICFLRQSLSV